MQRVLISAASGAHWGLSTAAATARERMSKGHQLDVKGPHPFYALPTHSTDDDWMTEETNTSLHFQRGLSDLLTKQQ